MSTFNYSDNVAAYPLPLVDSSRSYRRHPKWIKAKLPTGKNYQHLKRLMRGLELTPFVKKLNVQILVNVGMTEPQLL